MDPNRTRPPTLRPVPNRPPDERIGAEVGPYRILEVLGRGGMGVVYLAIDGGRNSEVALKFLSPSLVGDESARARFEREAKFLRSLDDANIGAIEDFGEHEGHPYLALTRYHGETLKSVIARGPLEITKATSLLRQIAAGLAAAHGAGLVHRDVKPANVMVTPEGVVKLLDFGIAKLVDAGNGTVLTAHGALLGTVTYAAPEQITGDPVDHRSDLWALGVVGYEMFTGVLPFAAPRRSDIARKILSQDPAPPKVVRPEVSAVTSDTILALLQRAPAQRIQSASAVAARLR